MPAKKEKPETTEKAASAPPAVDSVSAPKDKAAGPQLLARAADTLSGPQQGGAPGRARIAGSMQQNVGNSRLGQMMGAGVQRKQLLDHKPGQQDSGNGSDKTVMRAPGPLTAAQEAAAGRFNRGHYDERSIRIIQRITGANVDGRFGDISAQAVAMWQSAHGLGVDGQVTANTLNQMVMERASVGFPEHAIQLCMDFHNLNARSDTLSVQFAPEDPVDFLRNLFSGAPSAAVTFGPGNLRVIRVGPRSFFSEPTLFAAINAQLTAPAPVVPPVGVRPTLLTPAQERAAIGVNRSHFNDRRSVRAIQGHVGASPDGDFGPDTVQRIADAQRVAGLTVDGEIGRNTLERFVTELIALNFQDAAIRLIVDFYNFDESHLLDIQFDPNEPENAGTIGIVGQASRITVGPLGLAQPFPALVHSLAHEFEHVRQRHAGMGVRETREFLAEALEIMSVGMDEEDLDGLADDAHEALNWWNAMPGPDRRKHWLRFVQVRNRVRARIAAGTLFEQFAHALLLAQYNAVVAPP